MSTIYIHWPYCLSKCYYCDFNSIICKSNINYLEYYRLYKNVLYEFIEQFYNNEEITSIYFGGGTPSLVDPIFTDNLLNYIYKTFKISSNIEVTIEANPKTIDNNKAKEFKSSGINRISIGVQSIIDSDLKILGRIHNSYDAIKCVYDMHNIFNNVSIDVIYNRPNHELKDWIRELKQILLLPIQHISMYELIIENNTYIKYLIDNGFLSAPNKDSRFMEETIKVAESNGFEMYEISNYFKKGTNLYSKHNLSYWNYDLYYGVGAGSHSRVKINNNIYAIEQNKNINNWLMWAENPIFNVEELDKSNKYNSNNIKDNKLINNNQRKISNNVNDNNLIRGNSRENNKTMNNDNICKERIDNKNKCNVEILSNGIYKDQIDNDNECNIEVLSDDDIYKEQLIMGLRTKFGIDINKLNKEMVNKYKLLEKIKVLKKNSYIIEQSDNIKSTIVAQENKIGIIDSSNHLILSYDGMLKLNMIIEYLT